MNFRAFLYIYLVGGFRSYRLYSRPSFCKYSCCYRKSRWRGGEAEEIQKMTARQQSRSEETSRPKRKGMRLQQQKQRLRPRLRC